ncbi:MAG TPA: metallophosphoesterase, partial [Herpetosiphonaceae bacterium]
GTVDLRIERHSIPVAGLPAGLDGLRIGQLSDMHFGPWYSRRCLAAALAALRREQPDLIALTGDFIDRVGALPELGRLLAGLSAPLGVWACLGNHDYWSDPGAVARALDELGVRVLVNGHGAVRRGGAALTVAGVADPWFGAPDLAAALAGAPDAPVVLLAHAPDYADKTGRRIALQLSGHAHAGHVNLPLLGPLVVPLMGERYRNGLYRAGAGWLYVSRGLGGLPIRLGAPPEAAILTLRRA